MSLSTRHATSTFHAFVRFLLVVVLQDGFIVADGAESSLECDLYIAESTLPKAGLGLFTGSAKSVGDTVGSGDVCLPLFNLDAHNGFFDLGNEEYVGEEYHDTFSDYVVSNTYKEMHFQGTAKPSSTVLGLVV